MLVCISHCVLQLEVFTIAVIGLCKPFCLNIHVSSFPFHSFFWFDHSTFNAAHKSNPVPTVLCLFDKTTKQKKKWLGFADADIFLTSHIWTPAVVLLFLLDPTSGKKILSENMCNNFLALTVVMPVVRLVCLLS